MRRPRRRFLTSLLALGAAAVAGCGGGQPQPTIDLETPIRTPETPTTKKVQAVKKKGR